MESRFIPAPFGVFVLCTFLLLPAARAQQVRSTPEQRWIRHQVTTLCSPNMEGRGYVRKGRDRAASYIQRQFRAFGVQPAGPDSAYLQTYSFPVNTFPDTVSLRINGKELTAGEHYLVDAASNSFHAGKLKISKIDLVKKVTTKEAWPAQHALFARADRLYYLQGLDSIARLLGIRQHQLVQELPQAAYIVPVKGKMTWTVATDTMAATVFYVQDSVLPRRMRKAGIDVHSRLEPAAKSSNVIGLVRGTAVPDSYIVFTAHYDHLGRMGYDAVFPGASDNASGTALMLYLANYYAARPQRYSLLFIAFSGEEAGLKGSGFYVKHPWIPLSRLRFLVNLDIMGDATDGVTVVNATEFPKEFSLLENLNNRAGYLPQIRSRGKAVNSDHYHFTEAGVPAFFLYSNGGKGYYHDVFDKPAAITLANITNVAKLLQDFTGALQGTGTAK